MKKKFIKSFILLLSLSFIVVGNISKIAATSVVASISAPAKANVGDTINYSVIVTTPSSEDQGIAFEFSVQVSENGVIRSSEKVFNDTAKGTSYTFDGSIKASQAGSIVIKIVSNLSVSVTTGEAVSVSGSKSIAIQAAPVVITETETKTDVVVPFKTVEQKDSTLDKGKTVVKQEGKNGIATVTYTVTYTDGKETSRKEVSRTVTTDPINKIVLVGTKVTNAPVVEKSNDATLKGLTISEGVLSPTFNKETKSYSVDLKGDVTSVTITGTVNDTKASISGNGTVSLPEFGSKSHSLVVTAEDGTKNTITINFKKPEKVIEKSNDATLKSLTVSEGVLSPTFSKETKSYSVDLKGDVTSVTITGTVNDSKASISGNGLVTLPEFGNKSHSLVVTAEDGTKNTITINFKKPEEVIEKISLGTGYTWQAYTGDRELQGYTAQPLVIDGKEITAYVSASGDVVVFALNEAGSSDFYHYNKTTKSITEKFETIVFNETDYVKVKVPDDMVKIGMKLEPFTVSGVNLDAFSFDDENLKDYRILYLSKQGEAPTNYLFDTKSNTLLKIGDAQLLSNDEISRLESNEPGGQVEQTPVQPIVIEDTSLVSVLFMVIGVISLLCLILSVVLFKKSRSTR